MLLTPSEEWGFQDREMLVHFDIPVQRRVFALYKMAAGVLLQSNYGYEGKQSNIQFKSPFLGG